MPGRANKPMPDGAGGRLPPEEDQDVASHSDGDHVAGPMLTLDPANLRRLGDLFRLLGDRTRLAILQRLSSGETNVGALCKQLELPQPTVSHHLSLLRVSGLIDNRRAGKQVFYRLNGRVSPVALPGEETLDATKAGDAIGHDEQGHVDATGMQIVGHGFAIQILGGDDRGKITAQVSN